MTGFFTPATVVIGRNDDGCRSSVGLTRPAAQLRGSLIFLSSLRRFLASLLLAVFLKAFAVGEYLSFASPKERYQRKGDPGSFESPQ
jgi:hypothetical protein